MKFKYSAFTENTPEMREWLEKLGYRDNRILWLKKNEYNIIISVFFEDNTYAYMQIDKEELQTWIDSNKYVGIDTINCLGNPQLFQAVTAIREDSDYMQWFVIDRINGATEEYVSDFRLSRKDKFDITEVPLYGIVDYHKATLSDLIAHFKIEH